MNSTSASSSPATTDENAPAGRGRPHLLTPEIATAIMNNIRVYGLSDSRAGLLVGVSSSTLARWKQESEVLSDYLEGARAEFERDRVLALLDARKPDGSPDWRAQAWLLRNASREGGWGKAANPLQDAAPQNAENLPKNTPAPASAPEPAPAAPAECGVPEVPRHPATAPTQPRVVENPNSVPKIVPREREAALPPFAIPAQGATEALARVA